MRYDNITDKRQESGPQIVMVPNMPSSNVLRFQVYTAEIPIL